MANSVLRQQAEQHAKTRAAWEQTTEPSGKTYRRIVGSEGGFRRGDNVQISDPDDYYNGRQGVVTQLPHDSERTVHVTIGKRTFCWCIAALLPA